MDIGWSMWVLLHCKNTGVKVTPRVLWEVHTLVYVSTLVSQCRKIYVGISMLIVWLPRITTVWTSFVAIRNLNIDNQRVKIQAYKTLVRSLLKYRCTVWDTKHLVDKLEMVLRRAARFTLNRSADWQCNFCYAPQPIMTITWRQKKERQTGYVKSIIMMPSMPGSFSPSNT